MVRIRFRRPLSLSFAVVLTLGMPAAASAQDLSVSDVLSFLVTNQQVPTADFVKDRAAAAATRDTIAHALLVELATLPISTSSGGFTYEFSPALGTMERASQTFGPFFLDRALTAGRGQASLGLTFRHTSFGSLDGRSLTEGTLVTTANRFLDEEAPFDVETLELRLRASTFTFVGNYGVSDRLDVGAAVPVVTLRLDGERTNVYKGESLLQARGSAVSTGIADVALRAKYQIFRNGPQGVAAAAELRLPTGDADDLRGAGKAALRLSGIGSMARGPVEAHANLALTEGGISREVSFGGAVGWAATGHVTLSGELLVRRIGALGRIVEVSEVHPTLLDVETIRLLASGDSATTGIGVVGVKWNVARTVLVSASLLLPLNDRGLKSRPTPAISIDYALSR